jgi:hypothetical protein
MLVAERNGNAIKRSTFVERFSSSAARALTVAESVFASCVCCGAAAGNACDRQG